MDAWSACPFTRLLIYALTHLPVGLSPWQGSARGGTMSPMPAEALPVIVEDVMRTPLILLSAVLSLAAANATAAPLKPGNFLAAEELRGTLREYTPDGTLVQSVYVSHPHDPRYWTEVRDIVVDRDANVRIFNDTYDPAMT